jgi:hypothetical protein
MRKNILNVRGFKLNKLLGVLAIFTLIAMLLMIETVAEAVVSAGNKVGINMPVVPVFRQAAANLFLVGAGAVLFVLAAIIVVPVIKISVIIVGLGLAVYGLYQLYKLVTGGTVQDVIPRK